MIELVEWFILITSLPARHTTARMRLWRAVKALGCVTLRDGVYLLPASEQSSNALAQLASEVRSAHGSAEVLHVAADATQDAAFRSQFDRSSEYGELLARIQATPIKSGKRKLQVLKRTFNTIAATDYFPAEAQRQAADALAKLEAHIEGEPQPVSGTIQRLASVDFSGRVWATRRGLRIDRLASAWLICRFIDPSARFLWLASPDDCPRKAVGFDFDGATFTHVDGRVTFEVLAASFGLDSDPALARLGTIIHFLDIGGAHVAEAAGIDALIAGLRATAPNDDHLLQEASRIFDGLYENYRRKTTYGR